MLDHLARFFNNEDGTGPRHEEIGTIAVLLNHLHAIQAAVSRGAVVGEQRRRWVNDVTTFRSMGEAYVWKATLPEPDITEVIRGYHLRPPNAAVQQAMEVLKRDAPSRFIVVEAEVRQRRPDAPRMPVNQDGVPTLFFLQHTTENLARFLLCVLLRWLLECNYLFAPDLALDILGVFVHLAHNTLLYGYDRRPGLVNTVDPTTGLPSNHGGLLGRPGRMTYTGHEAMVCPATTSPTRRLNPGNPTLPGCRTRSRRLSLSTRQCRYPAGIRGRPGDQRYRHFRRRGTRLVPPIAPHGRALGTQQGHV